MEGREEWKRDEEGRGWRCGGRKGKAKGKGMDEKTKEEGEKGGRTGKRNLDPRISRNIDATERDNAFASPCTFETNHSVVLCPHRISFSHTLLKVFRHGA